MLVQVEGTCLFQEKPSGISVYGQNLIKQLGSLCDTEVILPFSRINKYIKYRNQQPEARVKFKNYKFDPLSRKSSLVHGIDMTLPNWSKAKKILTIHDIYLFLDEREEISKKSFREKKLHQLTESISKAEHFISVSQKTKEDFCDFFSVNENKVSVAHLGYSKPNLTDTPHDIDLKLPKRYILFIGTLSERKNCLRMLEAFSMLKDEEDLEFVFAGGQIPGYPFQEKVKSLKLGKRVHYLSYVNDSLINYLYLKSQAFIFPTLYEGFGIPLLEAASRGIPVLTSKRGAAQEVLGERGVYVDPFSSEEISEGIKKVLMLKNDLVFKSKLVEHSKSFSWDKMAKETFKIYQNVLGVN